MGKSLIAVPIHLDALYVDKDRPVEPAMADFTRLPYFYGERDVNAESPWLGETAASEPLGNAAIVLKKGIHLHWRFPKGLTTGFQASNGQILFPHLPDRWLIVRGHQTGAQRVDETQWVIESNYLHSEDATGEGAVYPIEPSNNDAIGRPYRYLGRTLPLNEWGVASHQPGVYLDEPLTAVGYGEPTYASFYPNCSRQFGFHDPEFDDQNPSGLYYQVIGWYSDPEPKNVWSRLLRLRSRQSLETSLSSFLKDQLRWSVAGDVTANFVIACHGSLVFRANPDAKWAVSLQNPAIAFGATMTEALSAYLANEVAVVLGDPAKTAADKAADKAMIEDKLEAIMLDRKLSTRTVDLTAKFKEARHEKGFDEVYAGILWTVRAETSPAEPPDASPSTAPWPDVAEKLDVLNGLQNAYQLAWDEIRSLHARLYSDWCRYLRLSHSPWDPASTLKIPEAGRLIEQQLLEIDQKIADVGTLDLSPRNANAPLPYSEAKPNSLARQISALFDSILQSLDAHEKEPGVKVRYGIQPAVAPRYWSPTEPVILLTGEAPPSGEPFHVEDIEGEPPTGVTASVGWAGGTLAKGTYQYNVTALDGTGRETLIAASNKQPIDAHFLINLKWEAVANATAYKVYRYVSATSGRFIKKVATPSFTDDGSITPASALTTLVALLRCELLDLGDIKKDLSSFIKVSCSYFIGRFPFEPREWKVQPWHPLLLQWEVELTPFLRLANLTTQDGNYDEGFITKNFTLKRSHAELSPITVAGEIDSGHRPAPDALVYRGSSLLTPHAVDQFLAQCHLFLERLEAQRQDQASGGGQPVISIAEGDDYRSEGSIEYLISRLKSEPSIGLDEKTVNKLGDVLKRFEKGNFFCLAQRLSGFNQAMLIHRQTLRIPIRDPIGFKEDRELASRVEAAFNKVEAALGGAYPAPEPRQPGEPRKAFCPIRAGELRVKRLRLVSTFGRQYDFPREKTIVTPIVTATPMQPRSSGSASVFLAPRLVQPARMQFRWLAAETDQQETNAHPESTPICGWVIANHLDRNLFVYSADGRVLGYMEAEGNAVRWRPAPGATEPVVNVAQIRNSSLRQMVEFFLLRSAYRSLTPFLNDLQAAQAGIEPEKTGYPLPMGQPLALVRAKLNLELQGLPATQHNWIDPGQDAIRGAEDTRFTAVRFPIRLGERDQLNDGLAVYWAENEDGTYKDKIDYVIPNYDAAAGQQQKKSDFLYQSIDDAPLKVTMLVDPRGVVHAATGILPSKAIEIPPHQYASAMQGFEVTFLQAPVLAARRSAATEEILAGKPSPAEEERIALPVSDPPGYLWSWIEKRGDAWIASAVQGTDLFRPFAGATEIREGWLKLAIKKEQKPKAPGGNHGG